MRVVVVEREFWGQRFCWRVLTLVVAFVGGGVAIFLLLFCFAVGGVVSVVVVVAAAIVAVAPVAARRPFTITSSKSCGQHYMSVQYHTYHSAACISHPVLATTWTDVDWCHLP
ncbi:unnamed protein product [Polarella glacialis]|uniref:Uncharacterized protein n=1 Tax=Polarella glacialis TaxID=89957 RepID=A0A813EDA1_POLGL|nr:unnamed protein product [Polarella glacialis]CAE8610987.1 unnamed protein product [Polarella glacialis]CAE8678161.1 unnamed protein product [Polarella glacialis]CAE8700479.1 unnamed protein product [Polarella glacialis]